MGLFTAEVERLLQAARLHLGKGELHEAVGQATEVIRRDSKQPAAYLVRAEAHRRLNHPDRALADLAVAIRLDPNQPSPYVIRAEILKRRNLLDQAIADATHALTLDPRNAAAFSIRAECRSAIGDMEGAGEDVQEMLLIDPTRPVPTLEAKRASSTSEVESGNERFWKQAGGVDPKRQLDIFADGKPVDKTYRSRQVVNDEEAPEALGVASGYKPESIAQPLPRIHERRSGQPILPVLAGLVCLGLLGGGYVLINQSQNSQDANPPKAQTEPSIAPTVARSEPVKPTTVSTSPPADEEKAQPSATTSVSPVVLVTNDRDKPPTTSPLAAIVPVTTTTVPSIEGSRRLEGHTGVVLGLAFSPDGKWLASASGDSTVRLWNVAGDQDDNTHIILGMTGSPPPKGCVSRSGSGLSLPLEEKVRQ